MIKRRKRFLYKLERVASMLKRVKAYRFRLRDILLMRKRIRRWLYELRTALKTLKLPERNRLRPQPAPPMSKRIKRLLVELRTALPVLKHVEKYLVKLESRLPILEPIKRRLSELRAALPVLKDVGRYLLVGLENRLRIIKRIRKYRFELLCILPLFLFMLFFTLAPIGRTVLLSFQDKLHSGKGFGFTLVNYKELILQGGFGKAFSNTIFIALGSLTLEIGLGLILALILSHGAKEIRFLRPLFILPLAIPTVVVGVAMSFLFSSSGWINRILADFFLRDSPVYWMAGGIKSLVMITLADCWKVTPIVMLILLAGLESINRDLYRAARIDGAGGLYIFKRITLPLLMPSITAAVIIRGIDAFRIFALPLILMGQNLKVIGTYAYLEYAEYNNPHSSAASSVLLLSMILAAILFYVKAVGKRGMAIS